MKSLNKEQHDKVVELNEKGLSLREIGKVMDISHESVRTILSDLSPDNLTDDNG